VRWLLACMLVVRELPASKGVNVEVEGFTALEAVTKRQVKTRQTEKRVHAVVNCRMCELAIAL
jgi:hypothetical protein